MIILHLLLHYENIFHELYVTNSPAILNNPCQNSEVAMSRGTQSCSELSTVNRMLSYEAL
jgi:hypothetical protein